MSEQVDAAEIADVVRSYRLVAAGTRASGRLGAQRGRGPGSSLEFHDFRDYAPGDDLRHVDWTSYARTDQLRVRLHEAEVAPLVEVLLDTSASMAIRASKRSASLALVRALLALARGAGSRGRALALHGGELTTSELAGDELRFDGPAGPPQPPQLALRPGSVRMLVSDALWPSDAGALLRRLAGGASRLVVLQLLDPSELRPEVGGAVTLVDCESGERRDLRLDEAALREYEQRLQRHCSALCEHVVRLGGSFASVGVDRLAVMCRRDLLPARIVEPA
ncbi:MAG: DUF58 domain-containing protein [Planctomycetota bacterium]